MRATLFVEIEKVFVSKWYVEIANCVCRGIAIVVLGLAIGLSEYCNLGALV